MSILKSCLGPQVEPALVLARTLLAVQVKICTINLPNEC